MKNILGKIRKKGNRIGDKWKGLTRKMRIASCCAGGLLLLATAAGGFGIWRAAAGAEEGKSARAGQREKGMPGFGAMEGDFWYASGLTDTGLLEDIWELDFLETPLVVEETYLHVGDEVKTGDPVFKVTQDSLEESREQLEKEQKKTQLNSRQGLLDYETGKIEAKSEYDRTLIAGRYAQADYENALAQAREQVDSLQKQVEEAQQQVDTYTASVEEDYYRTYYQVEELRQLYEDNFTYLMQLYEAWNIAELETSSSAASGYTGIPASLTGAGTDISSGQSGSGSSSGNDGKSAAAGGGDTAAAAAGNGREAGGRQVSDEASRLAVYQLFDKEVTREAAAYQEAKEQYEEASAKAAAGLKEAESRWKLLQAQLTEAQTDYETQKLTAQTEAEQKKAASNRAEEVYESSLKQLEEAYEKLKDEAQEAQENLELFETVIGDGCFYAGADGTVVQNNLDEGQELKEKLTAAAYSDPQKVTVSVGVDQEKIAQVGIGDRVLTVIDGYGVYEGTVTSFDPVTQSQSRSRAEYTVTVTLDGAELEKLESALTAYVYFGLTAEQREQLGGQLTQAGGKSDE